MFWHNVTVSDNLQVGHSVVVDFSTIGSKRQTLEKPNASTQVAVKVQIGSISDSDTKSDASAHTDTSNDSDVLLPQLYTF